MNEQSIPKVDISVPIIEKKNVIEQIELSVKINKDTGKLDMIIPSDTTMTCYLLQVLQARVNNLLAGMMIPREERRREKFHLFGRK